MPTTLRSRTESPCTSAAPLSVGEMERFRATGWVRLRHAFAHEEAKRMRAALWRRIGQRFGARPDEPGSWLGDWTGLQSLGGTAVFRAIASPRLRAAIDQILGQDNWLVPRSWNMFLASPPSRRVDGGSWAVPSAGWHADAFPNASSGINLFVFYDRVASRGGGTLLLEGSHRLIARLSGGRTPAALAPTWGQLWVAGGFLAQEEFMAQLLGPRGGSAARGLALLDKHRGAGGEPLRVVEATGEPGDVLIWHDWMLHARPSHHEGAPRLMSNKGIRPRAPAGLVEALRLIPST